MKISFKVSSERSGIKSSVTDGIPVISSAPMTGRQLLKNENSDFKVLCDRYLISPTHFVPVEIQTPEDSGLKIYPDKNRRQIYFLFEYSKIHSLLVLSFPYGAD